MTAIRLQRAFLSGVALSVLLLAAPASAQRAADGALLDPSRGVLTLAPVLDQATAAVVNISVSVQMPIQQNPLMQDPFFRRFFGSGSDDARPRSRQVMAAGSGVIIDAAKGYVVTNNHVVEQAERINVTTKDGRQLTAQLLGRDPETDLAVVKVDAQGLSALPLADSDTIKVGDVVLAIGNPFGLGQTVTSGIISALGRSGLNAEHYESFIQTDAPINPGNSGGALINSKGELAGINTAIIAPGGGNVGIGFAVPSNMVRTVVDQLERNGEVRRGRIGVAIQTVTPRIASAMGLRDVQGVAVTSVERNSPAETAGLRPGDVVVALDGRPIRTAAQLRNGVGLREVGGKVSLTYVRNGERRTADMTIEARPTGQSASTSGGGQRGDVPQLSGATFAVQSGGSEGEGTGGGKDGQQGRTSAQRVVVTDVERGSRAWVLGLRAGDIIVAANRHPVGSIEDLKASMASDDRAIAIEVRRGDAQLLLFAG